MATPLTISIGIHVSENPERLAGTLAALAAHTAEPYCVSILGDGLDEQAQATLKQFDPIEQSNTQDKRGAAACFNRLTRERDPALFVFLENGAEPGPGWLTRVLAALGKSPQFGLAGPSTNRAWNQQGVLSAAAARLSDTAQASRVLEMSALVVRRFGPACRTLEPLYSLSHFCYVVTRAVVDALGEADEGYGTGPCWEMAYNIRAARIGFKGLWVCGAYVQRAPVSDAHAANEQMHFEASKHRYQDQFCGLRLRGLKQGYRDHCRGDACPHFAPRNLIAIRPAERAVGVETEQQTSLATAGVSRPLASCIMPTYNRRPFIARAVACFLAQDYPSLELIVADDGTDPIQDLLPADSRIRYLRLQGKLTTGEKRNAACREARGEYILHWDDDDWYSPDRVTRQVAALQSTSAQVCGSTAVYYYAPATNQAFLYRYRGSAAAWMGALAYPTQVWKAQPFEAIQTAEDVRFIARVPLAARADINDPTLTIATIHEGNTSPKMTTGSFWSPESAARVLSLMSPNAPSGARFGGLVSCIMPTWNRRPFVQLALACFRAQTYPSKELIVVDDGDDSIQDLVAGVPQVRYLRLPRRLTIGAKRNAACEEARGDFIAHWDDDDWSSPSRLSRQLEPLLAETDPALTGLTNSYVLNMPTGDFWRTSADLHLRMWVGDIHGGTIVYRKDLWSRFAKYPNVNLAEDAALIKRAMHAGKRIVRIDNHGEFVYLRHDANTWQFKSGQFLDPDGWQRSSAPPGFSPETLEAYRAASNTISRPT